MSPEALFFWILAAIKFIFTVRIWVYSINNFSVVNAAIFRKQLIDDRLYCATMLLAMGFDKPLAGWISGEAQELVFLMNVDTSNISFWTYLVATIALGWLTRRSGVRIFFLKP
jgi:hypothetical protein